MSLMDFPEFRIDILNPDNTATVTGQKNNSELYSESAWVDGEIVLGCFIQ